MAGRHQGARGAQPESRVPGEREPERPRGIRVLPPDAPLRPDLLGAWLVTHIVSACPLEAEGLALEARVGEVYVYRNTYAPEASLTWDGPNRVTVTLRASYAGPLYAVASGHWRDAPDDAPGLPGPLNGAASTWTFAYDPSEVWRALGVGAALVTLAALILWGAGRHA